MPDAPDNIRDSSGRFLKGGPGGPGRGKSPRRIEGLLRKLGEEIVPGPEGLPITRLERLMGRVYDLAEEGQQWAVAFVAERTEGKISERQEVAEENREPVKLLDIDVPVEVESGSDG